MRRNNTSSRAYRSSLNALNDLIQRCHQRQHVSPRQRRTVVTPALDKGRDYHFRVHCAHQYPIEIYELEQAEISFMPIGRAPEFEHGPRSLGGKRFSRRQKLHDWDIALWQQSWGIQIYTGAPSGRDGAYWHDIEFKYAAICAAPPAVLACIESLVIAVVNPLLTVTESGGIRFSCRVPSYLHPSSEAARFYIYKDVPTAEDPYQRDIYLEILGKKGYSRWDARYEILLGNLLNPPIITREALFDAIDVFRDMLHQPINAEKGLALTPKAAIVAPVSIGALNLNLAMRAFRKRGFTYVGQAEGSHLFTRGRNADVSLWETEDAVWVRASTVDTGLPIEATPITDVWEDTGILPPLPATGHPVSEKVPAVQAGNLSPLAVKRPAPVLRKPESENNAYATHAENALEIERVLNADTRITGLIAESGIGKNQAIASYVRDGGAVSICMIDRWVDETVQRFQDQGLRDVAVWKSRNHLWDMVKEIPVADRMANPFQGGNVCEDPERCDALAAKGGDPNESICPQCPVYAACQARGYLSQAASLQRAKVQIYSQPRLFLDPEYVKVVEKALEPVDDVARLCIIDTRALDGVFIRCCVPIETLEAWRVDWQGHALGNFADVLLNALEIKDDPDDNAVSRIRTALRVFDRHAETLIAQMCQVNVQDKPMSMTAAIELGILDASTVENIQAFPSVYRDPNWTLWHQLKRFFAHYTRDVDAPMLWTDNVIEFWMPPVLHPSVKQLLCIASTPTEQGFRSTFPGEDIDVKRIKPAVWVSGNKVFQIRTDTCSSHTILNQDTDWDLLGISKAGVRIFHGIKAEIERDPSVKHAVISTSKIIKHLTGIAAKENVCVVTNFKDADFTGTALEAADVIWMVGIPYATPGFFWRRSQILFGIDAKPLCYEGELGGAAEFRSYKDERIQRVYRQYIAGLLTRIIGKAGLDRLSNKTVVLLTSTPLPDITDRPETLLFDWEDFEIAGGLDRLSEVVAERERYETELANLTAASERQKVEQVLGISKDQANRVLRKLRGGKIERVPYHRHIRALLSGGEKTTAEIIAAIDGHPGSIKNELRRLVDSGKIVKVRWGVYALDI